jgi:P-type Cu2+ transporter
MATSVTSRPDAATPCTHCGLPIGRRPVGSDPWFCCTGCEIVHDALAQAGADETFYRLRELGSSKRRPARTEIDELLLAELDSEAFIDEHTQETEDGSREVALYLDGVHCAACVWLVERLPYDMAGVSEARLDLPRARLSLSFDPNTVKLSSIARWLSRFGYQASALKGSTSSQRTEAERNLLFRAGVAWALAANVMLLALALYSGLESSGETPGLATAARWASFALAVPAVAYAGNVFFIRAWQSVRLSLRNGTIRTLHMDTPIALGVAVGFAHSGWATITGHGEVWFDSLTVLIAALLTARWLQLRSRRLAGDAGERLLSLIPTMVRRLAADGSVQTVPADDVAEGDLVSVPAGDVFPVDGTVTSGTSDVNNAVLTGESRLDAVEPGSTISAGATNVRSNLIVRVSAAGDHTRVGRLLSWVRDGSRRGAPAVLLADRLAGYFVLTVITLAALTATIWLSIDPGRAAMNVVALLVITCPCALGMATPLAMAVGSGKAARAGIYIKTDQALQALSTADAVVLDKTGTITEGTPRLTSEQYFVDVDKGALWAAMVELERDQSHPIARALTADGEAREDLPFVSAPTDIRVVPGSGISGMVEGRHITIGRPDSIAEESVSGDVLLHESRLIAERGDTPVAVSIDGEVAGILGFGDRLRHDAVQTIAALASSGKSVYLLSGDNPHAARIVGARAGIAAENIVGGATPEDKEVFVRALRERYRSVVMVGDGVNDAAALQAAHVGVAVHGGSTVSLVAADVFLTRDGVGPVLQLFDGSRHVMHVIRRNLGMSLAYNVFGAAAAMAGIVTPLFAAVAMPISSLAVVASSILQRPFPLRDTVEQARPPAEVPAVKQDMQVAS